MISTLPEIEAVDRVETSSNHPITRRPRIRVCMLAYAFYENDTRILQYATSLAQRADSVDVIALRRDDLMPAFEVLDGVNVYRIQTRMVNEKSKFTYASRILRFMVRAMWFLHRKHKQHPYDAIHVHNVPDMLVFAALSPKLKKVPVILDIHDLLPEFYASKFKITHSSALFKLMVLGEKMSAAFADHVIVANDIWRDRLAERSSHGEKCSVVRNRPDLEIFTKQPRAHLKERGKFTMIYPGSLNWHQGLDIAIRAFASVEEELPDAEFHIYGEGSAKPALMELAIELKQQHRIFFHDFMPSSEIAQVMARADLAIEPKRTKSKFSNEALSTKIMEFFALGVPVIACRTKIHAYYYDSSIIQYYEDDDESQLAQMMVRLRYDSGLRFRLVENAKKYVEHNTWDARKHEYLGLMDSLVRRSTQGRN